MLIAVSRVLSKSLGNLMTRRWIGLGKWDLRGCVGCMMLGICLLPCNLCYWLAMRVDPENKVFLSPDGTVFSLSPIQVHWILGIPKGPLQVHTTAVGEEMETQVAAIWDEFSSMTGKTEGIVRKTLYKVLESDNVDAAEFKKAFLILALAEVLCPTTSHRLSVSLLPAVTVVENARNYDWCTFVLHRLFHAMKNFGKRFYPDGYSKGCGGCTIFLALFYLDRLKRPPVNWGVFPRINAWCKEDIIRVEKLDELKGGDYGNFGCVDVAYNESHPMEARDAMPSNHDVLQEDCGVIRKRRRGLETRYKSPNRGRASSPGVPENEDVSSSHVEVDHENVTGVVDDVVRGVLGNHEDGAPQFGSGSQPYSWSLSKGAVNFDAQVHSPNIRSSPAQVPFSPISSDTSVDGRENMNSPSFGVDQVDLRVGSRKQRITKSCTTFDSDFVKESLIRGNARYKSKVVKLLVLGVQLTGADIPLLKCDGVVATLNQCSTMVMPNCLIDPSYVRVAALLYQRIWDKSLIGHTRRIMLDPDFAVDVLNTCGGTIDDEAKLVVYSKRFVGVPVEKLNFIFIPVYSGYHGWCATFSISHGDIGVMDSLDPVHAIDNRHEELLKLKSGVDQLIKYTNPSWDSGHCFTFRTYPVRVCRLGDLISSGVEMLAGVKQTAGRLSYDLDVGCPTKKRDKLVCEDLMSKENELMKDVLALLKEHQI